MADDVEYRRSLVMMLLGIRGTSEAVLMQLVEQWYGSSEDYKKLFREELGVVI